MDPLTSLSGLWETSGTRDEGDRKKFDGIPDGDHTAILKSAKYETNDKGASIVEEWYFPQFNKSETFYFNVRDSAAWIKMIRKHTKDVSGVDPQSPVLIPKLLKANEGATYSVKKEFKPSDRGGKGFRNIYVQKKLSEAKKADDLPFPL